MIDSRFYVNVKELMSEEELPVPRCRLPKPKLKPTVIVNHGEGLPLISIGV